MSLIAMIDQHYIIKLTSATLISTVLVFQKFDISIREEPQEYCH